MLKIFENSSLYDLKASAFIKVIHNEVIDAELLIFLRMDIQLQPELKEMLDKMVAALKLDQRKVEYLVFNKTISLSEIASSYKASNILIFGASPEELGLNMELKTYENYSFNSYKLLLVNNILDVYGNQNLKSKLWIELKELFN